jgi:IS30 family transposase
MKKQKLDQSHLTLDERKIIQKGIESRSNKISIAKTIGKDATTVAKEIRKHRELRVRDSFKYPIICLHRKECGTCFKQCDRYEEIKCKKRDRSPGACNKCTKTSSCHLDKYFYNAESAHKQYLYDLKDSREGFNLTTNERDELAKILKPLLDQKQSIYQILTNHKEIKQSEKTIYTYIESDVFKPNGIDLFSLKEKLQRKIPKNKYKKRKEPVNYDGRRYEDYLKYIAENPDCNVIQMDTVYNNPSGPYIQTLKFKKEIIQIGFIHKNKTSECMASSFDYLEELFGYEWFCKNIPVILTDRGVEFEKCLLFELNKNGEPRCKIFYCDPMQSSQKAECECNHNYVRDILPNEMDLSNITNEILHTVFSHINCTPRESLNGKTPFEMAEFIQGLNFLDKLNITKIDKDKVTLSPCLIKTLNK